MTKPAGPVRDMTVGNPFRLILAFAIPLFIGNVFQQFYNMVDTMVVGHCLGDTAIAAIGATSSLYSLLINFANGLNSGYSIVVTQSFGSHNKTKMRQAIAGMMLLDLAVTLTLTALALAFLRPLMVFLNTPEDIFELACSYISLICCGTVATIGYNMFASILRSVGNSRSPLYFLILSSLLNVALDLLFVAVLHMGVAGAAVATVIAQAISALLCGIYVFRNYREYLPSKGDFRVPGETLHNLFSTGIAMALMNCLVDCGSVVFSRANNLLGQTAITAYTASRKIMMMCISPLGNMAHAGSIFIGQNWGARQYARIQEGLKKLLALQLGWSLIIISLIFLLAEPLVRLTTGTEDAEVIRLAVLSLRIHFSATPALGILFAMRHALQATGHKIAPLFSSGIELAIKLLSATLLIPNLGFLGTCVTEPAAWVLMAAFLMVYYLAWRKKIFPQTV